MESLEKKMDIAFSKMNTSEEQRRKIASYLKYVEPLHGKYRHSIRVALLGLSVGNMMEMDGRALFYAGILHHVGDILPQPYDSYDLLTREFAFSADIIARFSLHSNGISPNMPQYSRKFSEKAKKKITDLSKVFAVMHSYDLLKNNRKKMPPGSVMDSLLSEFPNMDRKFIELMYETKIFT